MNPASGVVGTTVNVAIDGLNFVSGSTTVTVTGTGVTVGAVTVVNQNQLTTAFTIAPSAPLGVRNVTVTTPSGSSDPGIFLIGPPPPLCALTLNKTTFVNGEIVTAQVVQVSNPAAISQSLEFKFWFVVPGSTPIGFASGGADRSVALPAGFNQNIGPITLFTVNSSLPRGAYEFDCRFVDPVTGANLVLSRAPFALQ